MSAVINTNLTSLTSQNALASSQANLQTSIQRLSTGLRVNSAKDDAAGLSIATRMDSQVRGNTVALRNANDAISFTQTADGALSGITNNLQRMRDLAVQSSNDTNTDEDRGNIQKEFSELQAEVTRLSATKFNGQAALGGGTVHTYQIGADNDTDDQISVTTAALADTATAAGTGIKVDAVADAKLAIDAMDAALTEVNGERANMGAVQNRLDSVTSNLNSVIQNTSAAKSRIMDADFATETANLSRGQILQQAGTAMLAQANSLPNGVLALLR
jgi:flagellin